MYDPRPVRLQATASLVFASAASVMSPLAEGRTTKIGRSGPRPLAMTMSPSARNGVGAVIFELRPSRHSSLPVRGSYARMKFDALVTSCGPAGVSTTVGEPHDGTSSRSTFHATVPSAAFSATRKSSWSVSHCRKTRSFQITGELAVPHSSDGMS